MKKTIYIPEENKVLEKLKIRAVKAGKVFSHYITEVLIKHVEKD